MSKDTKKFGDWEFVGGRWRHRHLRIGWPTWSKVCWFCREEVPDELKMLERLQRLKKSRS